MFVVPYGLGCDQVGDLYLPPSGGAPLAILARLPSLHQEFPRLDLARMILAGHSAGGHLAFWAASRPQPVRPVAVVGLAPILDLPAAHAAGLGAGAVQEFLGGSPAAVPERYRAASPHALLPLGIPQFVLHGAEDRAVPLTLSQAYVRAAVAAGDDARCIVLPQATHMEFVDPASAAQAMLRQLLARIAEPHHARRTP